MPDKIVWKAFPARHKGGRTEIHLLPWSETYKRIVPPHEPTKDCHCNPFLRGGGEDVFYVHRRFEDV